MKVLFFGLGGVGQRHLRILKNLVPDLEISAVRKLNRSFEISDDLVADENVDLISKYNIKIFADIDEAIKDNPNFAVVSNPTSCHIETATQLVLGKVPVFMEKPISSELKGLADFNSLVRQTNVPVMVGYMMRFHPCSLKLKSLIESNVLGKIYSVVVVINSYMPSWHGYEKYNEFYAGQKLLGGGVVLTEIHELDLLTWFFGRPHKLWTVGGKFSDLNIDVEDTVSILIHQKYKDYFFPINITMSFVQPEPYRNWIVLGENGKIEWNISKSEIVVNSKNVKDVETFSKPNFERNDMFINQWKYFIECLNSGTTPSTALQNVLDGHLTALTIKQSLNNSKLATILSLS